MTPKVFHLIAVICLALGSGCVGVLPVPSLSDKAIAGQIISHEEAAFIVVGQTTRDEVLAQLGADYRPCPKPGNAWAYSWQKVGGKVYGFSALVLPYAGAGASTGTCEWTHWQALFVAFDSDGVVTRKKFVHLSSRRSLDEQLYDWAIRKD